MSRNFYIGFFALVLVTGFFLFAYKTPQSAVNVAEFGGVSLRIDYATTQAERELGLGGRTSVPDNYGMLFAFPTDDYYGFWIKDMLVPLDMFWQPLLIRMSFTRPLPHDMS